MAVDCGGHFLSVKQCNDFLLGRNKFSGLSLLQRLTDEMGKHFDFCAWEQLLNPEETEKESKQVSAKVHLPLRLTEPHP